jgi:1-aminocyclopropane-1-carboxylate deaminase/D-cysteine desulfhydrase-like pyridoxal-dependent ACC family enzyme
MPTPTGEPRLVPAQVGDGYGAPTSACREAIRLVARTEAVLLDPVYSGKAFAGLIGLPPVAVTERSIVFLVTGGIPALFVDRYRDWLLD